MKRRNNQETVLPLYGNSFDSMLRIAVHEELNHLDPELEAILAEEADVELPPQLAEYAQDFAKRKYKVDKAIARRRRLAKVRWSRVAIALLLAGIASFPILYGTVEAFRVGFNNVFFESREGNSYFNIHADSMVYYTLDPNYSYLPEYLPKNYQVSFSKSDDNIMRISYVGDDTWTEYEVQVLVSTDVHVAGLPDDNVNIYIKNCPGHITETSSGTVILIWYTDEYMFSLTSNLNRVEVEKIAQSVVTPFD